MPLPAALLAKLKKRGIVPKEEEEVIAESYDDEKADPKSAPKEIQEPQHKVGGAPGCPNKWIGFHQCSEFCWDKWGDGTPEDRLDPDYERKRLRMKRKYPLPPGWKEVYDPGVARHYYWNPDNDEVSWLSPSHPKAVISDPAPKLAKVVFERVARRLGEDSRRREEEKRESGRGGAGKRRARRSPSPKERRGDKRKKEKEEDPLDPMDPASYSDVPRGKWSAGMEIGGEDAVTGADVTASGPLFQQRPYPSPGAILRKQGKKPQE